MGFLSTFRSRAAPLDLGHDFAVVDVETTGFSSQSDRIVQIAITQLDRAGAVQQSWDSLVDPGRDPGPVHIHGISTERLRGAPTFNAVAPRVREMLTNRVVVAHNAEFDWRFLHAESTRAAIPVTARQRMCTLTLARRLDLDLPNFKLGTLATWADIRQRKAHDAADDVRVLHGILLKLIAHVQRAGLPLPLADNIAPATEPWPTVQAPRMSSPWALPGVWVPGKPLVQGMKFAVTGGTRVPREDLYISAIGAGLVPMNSVSGRTRVVVCRDQHLVSTKAALARDLGIPIIDDDTFIRALAHVDPGMPVGERAKPKPTTVQLRGPLHGCRVLVLGGPHEMSAGVRDRVAAAGGRVAVNLTPTVSHVIALNSANDDPRWSMAQALPRLDPLTLTPLDNRANAVESTVAAPVRDPAVEVSPPELAAVTVPEPRVLRRGEVCDLPGSISRWNLFVSWTLANPALELDVVAFITDATEKVLADESFVFFNNPQSPAGEVRLVVETDGESRLDIDLDELAVPGVRVIVGAALGQQRTFGEIGPVELVLREADGTPWARAVVDAGTTEKSMVLAEFYQRGDRWRVRSVGQGYDDGLAEFAVRHGLEVRD